MKLLIQSPRCIDGADKLSRPSARASHRIHTSPLPAHPTPPPLLFYVHIFFLRYSWRYLTTGRLMKIFPVGTGAFIAPTRFWHDRWFICFDNTHGRGFSAQSSGKTSKCFDRAAGYSRYPALDSECLPYRYLYPYYRNLKDEKTIAVEIIPKSPAHLFARQLFYRFLLLIRVRYKLFLYLSRTNAEIAKLENNADSHLLNEKKKHVCEIEAYLSRYSIMLLCAAFVIEFNFANNFN